MTKKKYSKSSSFYLKTKRDFFDNNKKLLKKMLEHNLLYASQPKRRECKLCKSILPNKVDFHSHKIDYVFCSECNHLNGIYEDTKTFVKKLYVDDEGVDYANNYIDKNYIKRTKDIYLPKVDFLMSSIPDKKLNILDIGCGLGYFVMATLLRKISVHGIDVSKTMIKYGNNQIAHLTNKKPLSYVSENAFTEEIKKSKANIISAIGVIEHLREPHKFFDAFKKSNSNYLYYSVPMFSFSVILENIFKNVFPRQLSGGHTHLFTEKSLKKLNQLSGVKPISEWRFGTDAMDFFRDLTIELKINSASQRMIDYVYEGYGKRIDEIQSIFDKNHFCSEIHVVAEKC